MNESTHAMAVRLARAAPIDPAERSSARALRRRAFRAASRWRPLLAAALCACGIARAADLVVPAYFYPSGAGAAAWRTLAANAPSVRLTAILNPDSGPGSAADPAYTAAVAALRAAGGKVIAYVHTSYGQRPLSAVTRDIHAYLAFYPVDGFFIDEMANDASTAHVQYYQAIHDYIKALSAGYQVVDNPGTNLPEIYGSLPVADRFVVYEDTQAHYAAYRPDAWQAAYPADRFIHIVYDAPAAKLAGDVAFAAAQHAGGVFVTTRRLPNPYGGLPSYWPTEVAAVKAAAPSR